MSLRDPVLIVGGYGYRNVGDEAILAGQLRRLAGHRVTASVNQVLGPKADVIALRIFVKLHIDSV